MLTVRQRLWAHHWRVDTMDCAVSDDDNPPHPTEPRVGWIGHMYCTQCARTRHDHTTVIWPYDPPNYRVCGPGQVFWHDTVRELLLREASALSRCGMRVWEGGHARPRRTPSHIAGTGNTARLIPAYQDVR